MTALEIPVRTMELVQTLLVDTTVAVQQGLLENNARKVSLFNSSFSSAFKGTFPILLKVSR